MFGVPLVYPLIVLCIVFSVIVFFTSHKNKLPKYDLTIGILAFFMSILWINIICNILMNFLELLALISGLRQDFLGLTFLAWGNSLGDLFANSALSKKGYGVMAVTGCFAGQLFNLLIGFGIALIRNSY